MIKALGCNFVRLVHYPHDRRVVELADELGLASERGTGLSGKRIFRPWTVAKSNSGYRDFRGHHPARLEFAFRDDLVSLQ